MIAKKLFVIGYLLIEILIIVHQNSLDGHFANWKTTFNTIHETKFNLKKKTFELHFFSMESECQQITILLYIRSWNTTTIKEISAENWIIDVNKSCHENCLQMMDLKDNSTR